MYALCIVEDCVACVCVVAVIALLKKKKKKSYSFAVILSAVPDAVPAAAAGESLCCFRLEELKQENHKSRAASRPSTYSNALVSMMH